MTELLTSAYSIGVARKSDYSCRTAEQPEETDSRGGLVVRFDDLPSHVNLTNPRVLKYLQRVQNAGGRK